MTYIQYNDDPLKKRTSTAFANLCASQTSGKKSLRLVDKCFMVFDQAKTDATYCALQDFAYPVDNQNQINFEVCAGETLQLFDNQLDEVQPLEQPANTTENYPLGNGTEYIKPIGSSGASSIPTYYLLSSMKNYARGILLSVTYASIDSDGNDTLDEDTNCTLTITCMKDDGLGNYVEQVNTMPLDSFFAHFSNPLTRSAVKLINKIELTNNTGSCATVTGLILYTKSNIGVSDCAC